MARDPNLKHVKISPDIDDIPFADFVRDGWTLEIACWSKACRHTVYMAAADLVARYGPRGTTRPLARRAACRVCGSRWPAIRAVIVVDSTSSSDRA